MKIAREGEGRKTVTIERIEKLGKDLDDYSRHTRDIEKKWTCFFKDSDTSIRRKRCTRFFLKHSDTAEKDGRVFS